MCKLIVTHEFSKLFFFMKFFTSFKKFNVTLNLFFKLREFTIKSDFLNKNIFIKKKKSFILNKKKKIQNRLK